MNKLSSTFEDIGIGTGFFGAVLSANIESVLALILTIASIVSIVVGVVSKIISWFRKAKADGKITKEELVELISSIDPKGTKKELIEKVEELKGKAEEIKTDDKSN